MFSTGIPSHGNQGEGDGWAVAPPPLPSFIPVIFHPIVPSRFGSPADRKGRIYFFFPSISWEGGGQNQRTLIFFSVSSAVSKSLSGEPIKLQLNLSH